MGRRGIGQNENDEMVLPCRSGQEWDGKKEQGEFDGRQHTCPLAVEFPAGSSPPDYQRFSIWGDTLNIISGSEPDGSNCYVYYGTLHTLDADGSTVPAKYEDLVATGACAYAAIEWAAYAINKVNVGGTVTPKEFRLWGNERLGTFQEKLERLGRRQRVRTQQLFGYD